MHTGHRTLSEIADEKSPARLAMAVCIEKRVDPRWVVDDFLCIASPMLRADTTPERHA